METFPSLSSPSFFFFCFPTLESIFQKFITEKHIPSLKLTRRMEIFRVNNIYSAKGFYVRIL